MNSRKLGAIRFSGLALLLGMAACTDPYDPGQRAVGGGLLGAGSGALLGAAVGGGRGAALGALAGGTLGVVGGAATTPPPPRSSFNPSSYPGYYLGSRSQPSGYPPPAYPPSQYPFPYPPQSSGTDDPGGAPAYYQVQPTDRPTYPLSDAGSGSYPPGPGGYPLQPGDGRYAPDDDDQSPPGGDHQPSPAYGY